MDWVALFLRVAAAVLKVIGDMLITKASAREQLA